MREGRGIRSAAVLMAGLVGAAVVAPGVAFADESASPSPTTCAAQGAVYDARTGTCLTVAELTARAEAAARAAQAKAAAQVRAAQARAAAQAQAQQAAAQAQAQQAAAQAQQAAAQAQQAAAQQTQQQAAAQQTQAAGPDASTDPGSTSTTPGTPSAPTTTTTTRTTISDADVAEAVHQLTGANRAGLPVDRALEDLPQGNLDLGDADVPDYPASGSFTSPKQACLFLASKVSVADADRGAVGAQFVSFCGALPTSFDPRTGYGTLPDLIVALHELCHGLQHTWHHDGRDPDLNCGELTGAAAQAILEDNPSDPNHLDGDHDGKACDRNPRTDEVVTASYDGYPQGGVATGDSTPGLAPGAAVALTGLGFATLAGATRRREDDEEPVDDEVRG